MGAMKDQVKGKVTEAKGRAKKTAGKVTGNRKLRAKGTVEQAKGKAQSAVGKVKRAAKKATR